MAGVALASPYLPFTQVLLMASRPAGTPVLVLAIVGVNFAGNLVLIPALGLAGAALSATASLVASALLLRVLARSRIGLQI